MHARIVHARHRCEPSGTLRSPLASLNSLVSSEPTLSKQLYLPNASFRAEYAWNVQDRPFAPSRKRRNRKKRQMAWVDATCVIRSCLFPPTLPMELRLEHADASQYRISTSPLNEIQKEKFGFDYCSTAGDSEEST